MNRKERRKQRSDMERAGTGAAPATPEALYRAAFEHHRAGRLLEARALYARALAGQPDNPELLHMAGVAAYEEGDLAAAVRLMIAALKRDRTRPEFHNNLGNALQKSGRSREAEAAFRMAVQLAPGYAEAHHNLGCLLKGGGRLGEAVEAFWRALKTQPNDAQTHHNLGAALQGLGRIEEAIGAYRQAFELKPDHGDALFNLGNLLREQGKTSRAIDCFRRILAFDPTSVRALAALSGALEEKGDHERALEIENKILAIDPSDQAAKSNRLKMLEFTCAWDEVAQARSTVRREALNALERGEWPFEAPFEATRRDMDPAYLLRLASAHSRSVAATVAHRLTDIAAAKRPVGDGRITVGYLSSDFRNHPVSQLIGSLFAHHDRKLLRVIAYSTGRGDGSAYRRQIEVGCDVFVDLHLVGTASAARHIREDGVDILIDLNGHTAGNRLKVFALRPAPVQVTYLGFPGTTGADFIDYMLADAVVAPPEQASFFSEKIVYLPGCYMVNCPHPISENRPTRADCGLPDEAFVFCSFCRNYKFEPVMFGVWMDILHQVPGSVLWLPNCNSTAKENLWQAAEFRGITASRLVFANRLDAKEDHLARSGLADLALDTRIFGGHTTTSDMLWAGVPVISLLGAHFASRVGASLLTAIGLEELVTRSLEEYRDLAVHLARNPAALSTFRQRLAANHEHSPLFDTTRFARNLERAFAEMWARHVGGLEPAPIAVADD